MMITFGFLLDVINAITKEFGGSAIWDSGKLGGGYEIIWSGNAFVGGIKQDVEFHYFISKEEIKYSSNPDATIERVLKQLREMLKILKGEDEGGPEQKERVFSWITGLFGDGVVERETLLTDKNGIVTYSYLLKSGLIYFGYKIYDNSAKTSLSYEAAGFESLEKLAIHLVQTLKSLSDC